MKTSKKIYWEQQGVDRLCGVHSVNNVLQGPFFNEVSLANIALELDKKEKELMGEQGMTKQFLKYMQEDSGNVAMDGYYSIQVLQEAFKSIQLSMISIETVKVEELQKKIAFVFNSSDHWFSLRKIDSIWYNLNSTNRRMPEIISDFYLEAFIHSVRDQGYQIFTIEGVFPESDQDKFEFYNKNQKWFEVKRIGKYHEKCIKRKNFKPNISGAGTDHEMERVMALSMGKKYQPYLSSGEDSDWDNEGNQKKKEIKQFAGMGAMIGDDVHVNYQKFHLPEDDVEMIHYLKESLLEQFKADPKNGKMVTLRYNNGKKEMKIFENQSTIESLYDYIWSNTPGNRKFYLTNLSNKERLVDVSIPLFAIEDQDSDISVIVNEQ